MENRKRILANRIHIMIIDLAGLFLGYLLASVLRYHGTSNPEELENLVLMCIILVISYVIVALILSNTNKNILKRGMIKEIRPLLIQFVGSFVLFSIIIYLFRISSKMPRSVYIMTVIFGIIFVFVLRQLWKMFIRTYRAGLEEITYRLLFADEQIARRIMKKAKGSFKCIIICDRDMKGEDIAGIPVVANISEYQSYTLENVVDEVFINTHDQKKTVEIGEYISSLGATVHIAVGTDFDASRFPNPEFNVKYGHVIMTSRYSPITKGELIGRRIFDIIAGLIGCAVTGVLYLIVAPQIKRVDPGPAIFKQKRVGLNGRVFELYKFRSMYMDAEARKAELMDQNEMGDKYMFKIKNDPRILPKIGKKIRRSSIDEFPQFINVLKGDMSLIGTRPPTVKEYEMYMPHHKTRLSLKPGITGLWQISGRNQVKNFEDVVQLDNKYIKNRNFSMDVEILLKTVKVILSRNKHNEKQKRAA